MADPLKTAILSSVSALRAQSTRVRVASENLANASVTSNVAGGTPYTRKTITFRSELDRVSGASMVQVRDIGRDRAPFRLERDPTNPAADATGNVKYPNVNPLVEIADLKEANRSYEANLQVVKQAHDMLGNLLDLMKMK